MQGKGTELPFTMQEIHGDASTKRGPAIIM